MHITHKYWSPRLWCYVVLLEDTNILKEHVISIFKTDGVVKVYWQVAGRWSIRYVGWREVAHHCLRQLEKWENKHKNGFFKVHNVLSQRRQNLPPKHLTTRLHHVTTQSTQKLEYLCYVITHLPNLQLADCYWCLTTQNFETSRQDVLHSYIQQIFHHVHIMHS